MDKFGISTQLLEEIRLVIKANAQISHAVIFGSRAKGNYKKYSDVDIALFGALDEFAAEVVREELEELNSPYKFDVVVYNLIKNEDLLSHIDRCGRPL